MSAKAAAVVVRLPDGRVLMGTRTRHARSHVGTLAFPGGAFEPADVHLPLFSPRIDALAALRACALRELGEETGLWHVCDADGQTSPEHPIAVAHALRRGRVLRDALLAQRLVLDDRILFPLWLWHTPDGRFSVHQWLLPLHGEPQRAAPAMEELDEIGFVSPQAVLHGWRGGRTFLIPSIRRVVVGLAEMERASSDDVVARLSTPPRPVEVERPDFIDGVAILPARSPTLPPATHTNAVLLYAPRGADAYLVDPATPYADEQARFDRVLAISLDGRPLRGIVCTHHHVDHVGDVARLAALHRAPVLAHAETAARVDFRVDQLIGESDALTLRNADGSGHRWEALHTPGHAAGHLCFFERTLATLVAGDMIASVGSILIDPDEGNMGDYMRSLERLIALHPHAVVPSHGPLITRGTPRLTEQLHHRRTRQSGIEAVLQAAGEAGVLPADIVAAVYGADTPQQLLTLAERSVLSALLWAQHEGRAHTASGRWFASAPGAVSDRDGAPRPPQI